MAVCGNRGPQNVRNTPRSKGRPPPCELQYSRNRRSPRCCRILDRTSLKCQSPSSSPCHHRPFSEILPDVGEQTEVASVRETVGEIIRTVVSMNKSTVPLGVIPVPLHSKPRLELLFQPPDLAPGVLQRGEPGITKLTAPEHADDARIVQCELDLPSDLRCPRQPQSGQEPLSFAAIWWVSARSRIDSTCISRASSLRRTTRPHPPRHM